METESGAEYISPTHVRHIMRYVKAAKFLKSGWAVLDAACGTGYGSAILAKECFVKGIDFNDKALEEASKNYPTILFDKTDLTKPFKHNSLLAYDAAVGIETIEHFNIEDIKQYLNNIKSNLVSRGTFIVTTPYCRESGPSPITKQHLHEFSLTDLEITLNDAGFSVEAIYPERHEGQAGRLGYCMVHCVAR